ncbi:MAG: hypothetical protein Q7R22_009545 [Verrucomicrobiota bacterium JB025]|nr:hypothetical protein [Verrucomicrobiota bacterium JB025]
MKFVARLLLASLPLLFLSGCVTKRKVTEGGHVVKDSYVFRGPFSGSGGN